MATSSHSTSDTEVNLRSGPLRRRSINSVRGRPHTGYDHRNFFLVLPILLAVHRDKIAFLELDRNQNVCRGHYRKEEVCDGHDWSRPKCEQPTHVQRMANKPVEKRRSELERGVRRPSKIQVRLPKTKQVEVIDQECTREYDTQA